METMSRMRKLSKEIDTGVVYEGTGTHACTMRRVLRYSCVSLMLATGFVSDLQAEYQTVETLAAWYYVYGSASTTRQKPSDLWCGKRFKAHPPLCEPHQSASRGTPREHAEIRA